MSDLSDPEYIAKLIAASQVMNPRYIEVRGGSRMVYVRSDGESYCYYHSGGSLIIDGRGASPSPTMKVTVDSPKTVPAKKPKKSAAPRAKRLKNPAIRKDGVILLKDKKRERES
jgi:hypothetical protein